TNYRQIGSGPWPTLSLRGDGLVERTYHFYILDFIFYYVENKTARSSRQQVIRFDNQAARRKRWPNGERHGKDCWTELPRPHHPHHHQPARTAHRHPAADVDPPAAGSP